MFFSKKNTSKQNNASSPSNKEQSSLRVSNSLYWNDKFLNELFKSTADIIIRKIGNKGLVLYLDGLVSQDILETQVMNPLMYWEEENEKIDPNLLTVSQLQNNDLLEDIVLGILDGNVALILEEDTNAYLIGVSGGERRAVEEPASEAAVRGPREGFTENLRTNTALVRFRIRTHRLKFVSFTIGEQTNTRVELAYIEGIVDPVVLKEVTHRLESIVTDSILESGYIEELIEDQPFSPFPQLQYSERADTIAGQLLEGRFAIFVENTPFVLSGPVTAWQMLQASEDYYDRFIFATFLRFLRFIFLFIALFTPSLYIAMTTYHQDMLPTTLILSIATAREAIPFPALVEAFIMEVAFEALREAGIRLPKTVGQAVSILGALVIGQAAVEAGIVSAPMVIIVSLTGIASFTIPRYNFAIAIRLLRFPLMVLAGVLGIFGIVIGTMWIASHMCALRSFGVPYLSGIAPNRKGEALDILIRSPWWKQTNRPGSFSNYNRKRLPKGQRPSPQRSEG